MKPKLLMTASTFAHIRSFHLPYLKAFKELGWETHVACGGAPREIPFADKTYAITLEKSMLAPGNLRASKELRKIIQREGFSLVICHTSLAACFTRLALLGLRKRPKAINVVHGYLFDDSTNILNAAVLKCAEHLLSGVTDCVLTMNGYDYNWAAANRAGRSVRHIPGMGVDTKRLTGDTAREAFGFTDEDYVLVYPAEFSARKNQKLLIQALPHMPERVKLLLPGEGALKAQCVSLAESLGVAARVVFPGQLENIAAALRSADAAVSCSRSEGLPFNVMEAMLCGLPVIASRVKGHVDLIDDSVNGLLFSTEEELIQCVNRLISEPAFARELRMRAKETAAAYTLPEVLPQVMEEYLEVYGHAAERMDEDAR